MPTPISPTLIPPPPGQYWPAQDGWYIGIICNPANGQAWHLVQPKGAEYEFTDVAWSANDELDVTGAKDVYDGHANTLAMAEAGSALALRIRALPGDCYLPSRAEALAMSVVPTEQCPSEWHWTSTQYSDDSAWLQYFYYGEEYSDFKGNEGRARAVRRLVLQNFSATPPAAGTEQPLTANHPFVVSIRRKLERWELSHLRKICLEQAEKIGGLQADLERENKRADYWYDECMGLIESMQEEGHQIGLSMDGDIALLAGGAA